MESFKVIGYVCPLGRYPSPITPIVEDDKGNYNAVYLSYDRENNNLDLITEPVRPNSKFSRLSDLPEHQKNKFEQLQFDYRRQRLFAISEEDIKPYDAEKEVSFFTQLLDDKDFFRDEPFVRISLAKGTQDSYLLYHELGSCKLYLQEYNPELLPFLEKEEAKFRENYPDFQLLDKNRERMRSRIYIASNRERATLICA
jgi:hypothetical protein